MFILLLFQQSTDMREISKEWSLSLLFEKEDGSLACNYWPDSLTCVPCKLPEHIVCTNIMAIWIKINRIYHWSPVQTKKSDHAGKQIMLYIKKEYLMIIFPINFSSKQYVVTPHLNHLVKTVQMRAHNICFMQN